MVLAFRAVPVWWRWRSDARAQAAEAIAQQRRVAADVAGFSRSLDTLSARVERLRGMGPVFLRGATPSEAASMLAAAVGEIARTSLVRIDALELHVDTTRAGELPRVRVDAQASGDIAGLAALLQGLERGPLLLAVRQVSVRPQAMDGPGNQVEMLAIHFSVEGLALQR